MEFVPTAARVHDDSRLCDLGVLASQVSWLAAHLALDVVVPADAFNRLASYRRTSCSMDVVEFAPDMCPARGFDDPAAFIQMVEASVSIGLQDA